MTNYKKLKKVIQEAVPEIMDLKFGCEVQYLPEFGGTFITLNENGFLTIFIDHSEEIKNFEVGIDKLKILGRPIRLADVLMAVKKKQGMAVDTSGEFFNAEKTFGVYWNLTDNNLDHQSDECKEFLFNLLVK